MEKTYYYRRLEHINLLEILEDKDINQALAYMVDFKEYKKLKVIPHHNCIEVSNDYITIVVILLVGFVSKEYKTLEIRNNVHLIDFDNICKTIFEFRKFKNKIKHIDPSSLFYMVLSRSKSNKIANLKYLSHLKRSSYKQEYF
jgi:hypothetical protein